MEEKINSKKILIVVLIVVAIVAIVGGIVFAVTRANSDEEQKGGNVEVLTDSDFEMLEAKDIKVKYNEETKETSIDFIIANTTNKKVTNQPVDVILMNGEEQQLAGVQITVDSIDAKSEKAVDTIVLYGNVSEIKKIQLLKPQVPQPQPEENTENTTTENQ